MLFYFKGGYPGSIDHLQLDAETFAEWTVDYVKLDGCYADPKQMDQGYPLMSYYLNQTQRPVINFNYKLSIANVLYVRI